MYTKLAWGYFSPPPVVEEDGAKSNGEGKGWGGGGEVGR